LYLEKDLLRRRIPASCATGFKGWQSADDTHIIFDMDASVNKCINQTINRPRYARDWEITKQVRGGSDAGVNVNSR